MALPTAPLGQLPNMNMPYQMPQYQKRSALNDAVSAFLVGLTSNVGGQVGNNILSRDYADAPAGFWSKLAQGPKENRQQYEARLGRQLQQEQFIAQMAQAEKESQRADETRKYGYKSQEDAANRDRALKAWIGEEQMNRAQSQFEDELKYKQDAAYVEALNRLLEIENLGKQREKEIAASGEQARKTAQAQKDVWLNNKGTGSLSQANYNAIVNSDVSQLPYKQTENMGTRDYAASQFNTSTPAGRAALERYDKQKPQSAVSSPSTVATSSFPRNRELDKFLQQQTTGRTPLSPTPHQVYGPARTMTDIIDLGPETIIQMLENIGIVGNKK